MNKALQVKEILGKHISRQRLARQFRLLPERELARQLGYSRATVSKALGVLEGEGVILRKKGSGTFIAANLQEQALKIALVMRTAYQYTDGHFRLIVDEILKYAERNNICIRIFDHAADIFKNDPDNNPLMLAIRNKSLDGVLIVSRIAVSILGRISACCPTVSINNILGDGSEVPCISCDYFRAGFLAGKYLLAKGHRKVAYVTENLAHPETNINFSGLSAVFEMNGIQLNENDILETGQNMNIFNERVANFFKNSDYSACFVQNTNSAVRMISVLERNGIRVPEDLSVIAVGNYSNGQVGSLKLTVIDNQLTEMCHTGLRTLQDIIKNNNPEGGLKLLTPQIIENNSVTNVNF
ncbi:MAG: LacI family DNA-binding transcriptional regulator [Victivallaceae bacterium]|nr:LacI family DNA-binding transcriptional regulator [Victivallaceae bacterium]